MMSINNALIEADVHGDLSKDKKENKRKKNAKTKDGECDGVDTSNFTIEERLVAAVWVHERKFEKRSMSQIKINFRIRFSKPPPTKNTLYFWEKKIFATGKVIDVKRSGRPCKRKSLIPFVEASLKQAPGLSIRTRAEQLSLPRSTLRKILTEDIKYQAPINKKKTNDSSNLPEVGNSFISIEVPKCNPEQQTVNMPCNNLPPPPSYSYPDTFGSLPISAFQHFITYPNNGHQAPSMVSTHSKMPTETQNHHVNVNVGPHIHTHQQHSHTIPAHHNYITNNQMQETTVLAYSQHGEQT